MNNQPPHNWLEDLANWSTFAAAVIAALTGFGLLLRWVAADRRYFLRRVEQEAEERQALARRLGLAEIEIAALLDCSSGGSDRERLACLRKYVAGIRQELAAGPTSKHEEHGK